MEHYIHENFNEDETTVANTLAPAAKITKTKIKSEVYTLYSKRKHVEVCACTKTNLYTYLYGCVICEVEGTKLKSRKRR